jgi:hypothetical protein
MAGVVPLPPAAGAATAFRYTGTWRVWPGVVFRTFQTSGPGGPVLGDLLDVDLGNPHVAVGLLHPPAVAAREPVSRMAGVQHAVAGVNGDFFNISESHPGVRPTGSAVGPEIADGRALKAAVPDGQRFGPLPPAGATTEDVIGVGADRTGRMASLRLTGTITVHGPLAPVTDPANPVPPLPRTDAPAAQPPLPPAEPLPESPPMLPAAPPPFPPAEPLPAPPPIRPASPLTERPPIRTAGRLPIRPSRSPAKRPPFHPAGSLAAGSLFRPAGGLAARPHIGSDERVARPPSSAPLPDGNLRVELRGLNQYALPVGGVGVFTSRWGSASRVRAVCGSDARRKDPCGADTAEVTVRNGVVTRVGSTVGAGAIAPDTTVLVGREAGAATLRRLRPGDRVRVTYHLAGPGPLRFAVGGFAVLRGGAPPPGLDATVRAARTAAGVSRNGRHLYLVVAESHSARSTGLTLAGLSLLLRRAGAHDAMNLDGGGSSTFALRVPGEPVVSLRNAPSAGAERPVANGIGVFVRS